MTRAFIFLIAAALATCLVGVPVLFAVIDDDSAPKKTHAVLAGAHDDDEKDSAGLGWLRALARAAGNDEAPAVDDMPRVGDDLQRLDGVLADGVAHCAPEIFGYDRKLLVQLQPNWRPLKPNLQPSWDARLKLDGIVVDEEKLRACNEAFAGNDCVAIQDAWEQCTSPFRGTLGGGEACTTNEQCVAGGCSNGACDRPNDCSGPSTCPSGMLCAADDTGFATCVDLPKDGEPCLEGLVDDVPTGPRSVRDALAHHAQAAAAAAFDPRCGAGRSCDENSQCFPSRGEGRSCGAGKPCAANLSCEVADADAVDGPAVGVCTKDVEEYVPDSEDIAPDDVVTTDDGAIPAEDAGCACEPLRDGKACVDDAAGNTKCVPVQVVDRGQVCDAVHMCRGSMGVSACIDGRCQEALSSGDACSEHDQCKDDLVCIVGACAAPAHAGQECSEGDDCVFGLDCLEHDGKMACGVVQEMNERFDEPPVNHLFLDDDIVINGDVPPDMPAGDSDDSPPVEEAADVPQEVDAITDVGGDDSPRATIRHPRPMQMPMARIIY